MLYVRESEGDIFYSLAHPPHTCSQLGLGKAKARSLELCLLHQWQGPKYLLGDMPSKSHWQGSGLEIEQPGLKLALTWNASIASDSLTCRATMVASNLPILNETTLSIIFSKNLFSK